MTSLEISILMPYKNAAPWIADCLLSIQNQSFQDWEVIGVNDSSTDESEAIFLEFQERDSRFKTFKNQGNGIIPALDLAFAKSKGKLISRMDADDLMPEKRLEQMRNLMLSSEPKTVVTGLVNYFSDQQISPGYLAYESWINDVNLDGNQNQNIYRECVIASPNWLTWKDNLKLVGGFGSLEYPEDYDLILKWYKSKMSFKVVPEVTLLWREHPSRTSRNSENYAQSAFFKLKIETFLKTDYRKGPLVIWGKNPKSKLITAILTSVGISFENHLLGNYKLVEQMKNPQILVAVYPTKKERNRIQKYFKSIELEEGIDWWWV